jgi:isoleucyl-tRNA synthetase
VLSKTAELVEQAAAAYDACEFHRVYQLCTQFCKVTLSNQYHDVLKDRLYTLAPGAHLRRSSQTALNHCFRALARVLGPVLAFTTDEAWAHLTTRSDFNADTLLFQGWPAEAGRWLDRTITSDVDHLFRLRDRVNEKIEAVRQSGNVGKSIEAAVTLRGPAANTDYQLALKNRDALAELFIVSQVHFQSATEGDLVIEVARAAGGRCPRCWRWLEDLSGGAENSTLCARCLDALRDR